MRLFLINATWNKRQKACIQLDAKNIDLCLSLFLWAEFHTRKAAIKLHTLMDLESSKMDLESSNTTFIHTSDGRTHHVNALDLIPVEPGSIYIIDRVDIRFSSFL